MVKASKDTKRLVREMGCIEGLSDSPARLVNMFALDHVTVIYRLDALVRESFVLAVVPMMLMWMVMLVMIEPLFASTD